MEKSDFTTTLLFNETPEEVFNAITNVRGWWSEEIEGQTANVRDVFTYRYEDVHHCRIQLETVVPNREVVWHVLDNYFNFTEDKTEWNDTRIHFDISREGEKTKLVFTHVGLTPDYECYDACRQGWTFYIETSLANLIRTGKGAPNAKGTPRTDSEKKLGSANQD